MSANLPKASLQNAGTQVNTFTLETVYRQYYKLLWLEANSLLRNEAEAEDIIQETFLRIWEKQLYTGIHGSPKAYLYKAVRINCLRKLIHDKVKDRRLHYYLQTVELSDTACLEEDTCGSSLWTALQQLTIRQRNIFLLIYRDDRSYKEAAAALGLSVNSIKTHLKLALRSLRRELKTG